MCGGVSLRLGVVAFSLCLPLSGMLADVDRPGSGIGVSAGPVDWVRRAIPKGMRLSEVEGRRGLLYMEKGLRRTVGSSIILSKLRYLWIYAPKTNTV